MPGLFKRHVVLGDDAQDVEATLSELFHENTKLHPDHSAGASIPSAHSMLETRAMTRLGRRYVRAAKYSLTPVEELARGSMPLSEAVTRRRTQRSFAPGPLTAEDLAELLFLTAGVTGTLPASNGQSRRLRAAPSAGGLYPIEVYVGLRSVQGLPVGVYHYAPREHHLEQLSGSDPSEALLAAFEYRESLSQAAVVFLFSGVLDRSKLKYGERGYRLALLEAGHAAQNLCLACTALGLSCMTVCGFYDDRANALLHIDGVSEAVLYAAYVGPAEARGDEGDPA